MNYNNNMEILNLQQQIIIQNFSSISALAAGLKL